MIEAFCTVMKSHGIINTVILFIICDIFFGSLRAIKQHRFNSSVGIDGAIRKIGMLFAMAYLPLLDHIMNIDVTKIIPTEIIEMIPIKAYGLTEFFGLLFVAYEIVSVLKNMTLSGLPVKMVWEKVSKFLSKWTNELPETPQEQSKE